MEMNTKVFLLYVFYVCTYAAPQDVPWMVRGWCFCRHGGRELSTAPAREGREDERVLNTF